MAVFQFYFNAGSLKGLMLNFISQFYYYCFIIITICKYFIIDNFIRGLFLLLARGLQIVRDGPEYNNGGRGITLIKMDYCVMMINNVMTNQTKTPELLSNCNTIWVFPYIGRLSCHLCGCEHTTKIPPTHPQFQLK
jgi:hypothetical protein